MCLSIAWTWVCISAALEVSSSHCASRTEIPEERLLEELLGCGGARSQIWRPG